MINAENAGHHSKKFNTMATRTRRQYLMDLANTHCSSQSIEQVNVSRFDSKCCLYVCVSYTCMYVRMSCTCPYVSVHVCMCVCPVHVCMCVCPVHVCMCVCLGVFQQSSVHNVDMGPSSLVLALKDT